MDINNTICAVATPSGEGGIGIIRISGPNTVAICDQVFRKTSKDLSQTYLSSYWKDKIDYRNFLHGYIIDPFDHFIIDEVMVALMKRPFSYTREDVIEIQSHSGKVVLSSILELLIKLGARIAEPGEFTKRAFLNGRIDLAQAEAVIDLIQSKNLNALKMANASVAGELSNKVNDIRLELLDIVMEIQAVIEFPDEISESTDRKKMVELIDNLLKFRIQPLIERFEITKNIREGFKVGIIGRPNVGKSSLLNALLNKNRAIVTDIPGTTRDVIEDRFALEGIEVFLYDTAGIRESEDVIEQMGVQKSLDIKNSCDLILFVTDITDPFNSEDQKIRGELRDSNVLYVVNKKDLVDNDLLEDVDRKFGEYQPRIYTSVLTNSGMDGIKRKIVQLAHQSIGLSYDDFITPNIRQSQLLKKCFDQLRAVMIDLNENLPEDICVIAIEEAVSTLGKIIGINIEPDILDHIFENFCIGK